MMDNQRSKPVDVEGIEYIRSACVRVDCASEVLLLAGREPAEKLRAFSFIRRHLANPEGFPAVDLVSALTELAVAMETEAGFRVVEAIERDVERFMVGAWTTQGPPSNTE